MTCIPTDSMGRIRLKDGTCCCSGFVVHQDVSVSGAGTCDSGIVISTLSPSIKVGDYPFNSTTSLDDTIYCTTSEFGDLEGGSILFSCGVTETFGIFNFGFVLLIRITTAGSIYGTHYDEGDWVLLVGTISYDVGPLGTCNGCTNTSPSPNHSAHLVVPTVLNTITISQGGVTTTINLTFSF